MAKSSSDSSFKAASFLRSVGVLRTVPRKPAPLPSCLAETTFSRTLIDWKSLIFWKVRPMPDLAIRYGDAPRDIFPEKGDLPRVGVYMPRKGVEHSGFAGAVRADDPEDLAAAKPQSIVPPSRAGPGSPSRDPALRAGKAHPL